MTQTASARLRLLVLLATLAGVLLTAALGRWQMGRAAQKQAIAQTRAERQALPVLGTRDVKGLDGHDLERLLHRRVLLQGHWLHEHTIWLENRQMQGRTGFHVLTPLQLQDSTQVLLVQRGWAARNFLDREALPAVDAPTGPVVLQGRLVPWPSRVYEFAQVQAGAIRQNLDLEDFRRQTGLPLQSISVQQTDADGGGLLRAWPEPASGVEKHHGYAFQWFGLSGLIALLYVWFQIVQPRRKRPVD